MAPQHLSNWIRAAKDGRFVLPGNDLPAFVPVVAVEPAPTGKPAHERRPAAIDRPAAIEIVIGAVKVRVPAGTLGRDVEVVLRAVRRCDA